MKNIYFKAYEKAIFNYPRQIIIGVLLLVGFLSFYLSDFHLDASSDALVLENDKSLEYYRQIKAVYGSDNILIITFTPKDDLFAPEVINKLSKLTDELSALPGAANATSILNVPLIKSPPVTLTELQKTMPTLKSPTADIDLAREELLDSPIYSNLLISNDGATTAILVSSEKDVELDDLLAKIAETKSDSKIQKNLRKELKKVRARELEQQQNLIASIRDVLVNYNDMADIYLGGVPMITVDSIDFIKKDLRTFGFVVLSFIVILLWLIFRDIRWVVLPVLTCLFAGLAMVGYLGLVGWNVTVVSSNFISLLLIITLSLTVHLIVRYRELHITDPNMEQACLITGTIRKMFVPCLYTALTTMVAFGSLVVSGIRPVIDFGLMMIVGVAMSFIIAFAFFPTVLALISAPEETKHFDFTRKITYFFAHLIGYHRLKMVLVYIAVVIFSVIGISKLSVENRFIDYYKESTEIYQGMNVIDTKLGGTTPLDIIIDAPRDYLESEENLASDAITNGFWFNGFMLEDIAAIHKYLDDLPETGKVLSFHTTIEMLKQIDKKSSIDSFYLGVLHKKLPEAAKKMLFNPYISSDGNQLRFSVRVFESDATLKRDLLLKKIENHLVEEMKFKPEEINPTGMLVLYNNLLKSLFTSQILTIGFVFLVIMVMFTLLFRNIPLAIISITPNIFAAGLVLGIMGWLNIPLDIMTITIAAICIGIAVDDTIHYVHRFRAEFQRTGDYWEAVKCSHNTIGRAMYYTSITVAFGFSILMFSNFVPTIYFGLLTGFALIMALVANLTLLPTLLLYFKPLKDDVEAGNQGASEN